MVLLGEKTDLVVQKFLQEHESTSAPRNQNDQKGRKGREATERSTFPGFTIFSVSYVGFRECSILLEKVYLFLMGKQLQIKDQTLQI